MTLIEQIQTEAPSQRVSGIRVLIAFGNPLGNAVGETAIATQHYRFLRAIFHDMTCTVWTSSGGLWRALSGTSDIECVPTISAERLATGFDLMFFDWIALGP